MRRVIAAVLLVTLGCSSSSNDQVPAWRSAVGIEASGCSLTPAVASGVVVGQPGRVMTVAHAVAGAQTITVVDVDGNRWDAALLYLDPASDLAVLDVAAIDDRSLDARPLQIAPPAVDADAEIAVYGRRSGIVSKPGVITRRIDVTIEDIYIEDEVERTAIEVAADIDPGDSGGPLIVDGAVVGLIYARSRSGGAGFAVDDRELRDALAAADATASWAIENRRCTP